MATSTLQTDDNEDLFLVDGRNLVVLTGVDAAEQSIRQATKMRLGEDQLNVNDGVDYLGTIFAPQPDFDAARASLVAAILSSPDVLSIESLTITIDKNSFSYEADIMTIYGQIASSSNQQA